MPDAALEIPIPTHPMCIQMHAHGYCICTMVACLWCDRCHAAHKPCAERIARGEAAAPSAPVAAPVDTR